MTVMLIKATPCAKQPIFRPRGVVNFDVLVTHYRCYDDVKSTTCIMASSARDAITSYLEEWSTHNGWISHWATNFVVETDAWPFGVERLEEVEIFYAPD